MAILSEDVKTYIVYALACYDSPSQVSDAVLEEFGVKVDRGQVQKYDPTKVAGKQLAKKFRDLFDATRAALLAEKVQTPIANKNYRLRMLQKIFDRAITRGNIILAKDVLAQASKENTVEVFRGGMSASYVKSTGLEGLTDDELERRIEQNKRALELAQSAIATAAGSERDAKKDQPS